VSECRRVAHESHDVLLNGEKVAAQRFGAYCQILFVGF
jgi:hypothetical protein